MKSKLILSLSVLGLSVGMLGMGIPTSAHSIEEEHTHESTQLFENDILANLQESHEEEVVNPNARIFGYKWRCYTCGYTSELHWISSTAVTKANAHAAKYGHKVTVYNA
ncbi:hypothetical protein [Enterococcus faecium]|uniref:hypothetical protein n=1 Tax=Enterococcus faecium TaxID=1352 RepID=UPI0002A264DD|nr:hypothetical protein [Enterococcus faecium]ELA94061.1 hypothetical protein OIA_05135 [Enterococcus faecium EnGen0018]